MAEGLLRALHGDSFAAASAGSERTMVKPMAVRAMADAGIDISGHVSKTLAEVIEGQPPFDVVVTVCDNARQACPWLPGRLENLHHAFEDPSNEVASEQARFAAFCRSRDEIRRFIEEQVPRWLELEGSAVR
jgi:arsenate reductase